MKHLYILFCLLVSSELLAQTDELSVSSISQTGLRIVDIHTQNNEEPVCDFAEAPEGCMGLTVINASKVPCRIIISEGNDTLYDSGEYIKSESGATIKINGNTSAYFAVGKNRPYKIKLQKKHDLLLRNEPKKYADKDWRLVKDAITLNTIVGLKLSEWLGFQWTACYKPCNLFINGDYRGCYLLIESVERNADCRIAVDKTTGVIIERDPYWWSENTYFETKHFLPGKGYRWTWKYPDEEDVTHEQQSYIQQYVNQAETSIHDDTYETYIDIASFARWVLAHDILGTKDSGGSNLYIAKYDNTANTTLQIPCLWDFDSNFQMPEGAFSKVHDDAYDFYYHLLFNSGNKAFNKVYKRIWNEVYPTLAERMTSFVKSYIQSDEGRALDASRVLHFKRWDYGIETVRTEADANEVIEWFNRHLPLLNERIQAIDDDVTNVNIPSITKFHDDYTYSLTGIRTTTPKKGIYIRNGQKYIIK